MEYRTLDLKGAILNQTQLEAHLEKIGADHNLTQTSSKDTYPIPKLKENFEIITNVYQLLNEHIELKIPIHPAGEWILDNYYIIEEAVKSIIKNLPLKKYKSFVGIANEPYEGFARIYVLAGEIVSYTDGKIESENLSNLLKAYQNKKSLSMDEIWNIGMFMQIAMIEKIKGVAEKIYSSQMQKYKVENIIERLVENKQKEELQFKSLAEYKSKVKGFGEMKYPFIEYMSYRLKKYGKKAYPFIEALEEQVNKMGMEIKEVVKKEHFSMAIQKITVGNCIISIKTISRMNAVKVFEEINRVEDILKLDPANIYEKMDYQTKVNYRNQIQEISKKTKISEMYIAKKCLELAQNEQNFEEADLDFTEIPKEENTSLLENKAVKLKKQHIGYYLIANGRKELLETIIGKKQKQLTNETKEKVYISGIIISSLLICLVFFSFLQSQIHLWGFSLILVILFFIPIQTIITQLVQTMLGKIVKPKLIPKLAFSQGIPKEYATFVVIPTILKNKEKVKEIMEKLEVDYLANKSENIYFALLGDCTAGSKQIENFDEEIEQEGIKQTQKLNQKYASEHFPKFHFFYRQRQWNAKEECYLGWERKRGLLNQFNEYVLGKEQNMFKVNTIEQWKQSTNESIPFLSYVITLDADTNLTLETGLELIGAMAHVLNTPILSEKQDIVIDGHALIQPRIGMELPATQRSIFTKIYAGSGGTDAYTNAISDIYQDNFEEGIFTGKGIYDIHTFSKVLYEAIPLDTVLSHDLLEGNYLRCGLASDILLLDGFPVGYQSYKTRLHRWIRGDWQIIHWLKSNLKNKKGEIKKNPFKLLAKYKIIDNLMRSLKEPMVLITFIYTMLIDYFFSITIWPIMLVLFISAIMPTVVELLHKIITKKEDEKPQKTFVKTISSVKGSIARGVLRFS